MGEDLTAVMDQQEYTGVPYPAMPAEARVALIVAKYALYGMVPIVIPSLFLDVPIPMDRIPAHEGTDLEYVNALAYDAGYTFYVDPGPAPGMNIAYWGPEIKVGVPQPAITLDMGAHDERAIRSSSRSTRPRPTLPIVFIQNSLTKLPIPLPVPPIDLLNPPLALLPPLPKKIEFMQRHREGHADEQLSEGGRARRARLGGGQRDSGSSSTCCATAACCSARQLVGVRGAGHRLRRPVLREEVTSTIKRGEFKQSFSLTRNGIISTLPVVAHRARWCQYDRALLRQVPRQVVLNNVDPLQIGPPAGAGARTSRP